MLRYLFKNECRSLLSWYQKEKDKYKPNEWLVIICFIKKQNQGTESYRNRCREEIIERKWALKRSIETDIKQG